MVLFDCLQARLDLKVTSDGPSVHLAVASNKALIFSSRFFVMFEAIELPYGARMLPIVS